MTRFGFGAKCAILRVLGNLGQVCAEETGIAMRRVRSFPYGSSRANPCWSFLLIFAAIVAFPAAAQDEVAPSRLVPFPEFVQGVRTAFAGGYVGHPGNGVRSAADFFDMRAHLLSLYNGVTAVHSFELDDQTFDCVPFLQQPSVRLMGITNIAPPPPFSPHGGPPAKAPDRTSRDAFGNVQECPEGTIPMRRITLDELARYETLQQFFKKAPDTVMQTENGVERPVTVTHRWSHAYQLINNYGGEGLHNVWVPEVNTASTEVFSLSQQWYSGGSGNARQTAEIGWQNYPQKWRGEKAVIFVYWTANNYISTGCYNLECPGFVQTSSKQPLGSSLSPVSTQGGSQYEEYFGYYLYKGNWWAAVGASVSTSYWVGYFPTSIYKGGAMSKYAQEIDIGGETAGGTSWAPMGSGDWANTSFRHAAYERGILYRNASNAGYNPSLTAVTQTSNAYKCYSFTTPAYSSSSGWDTYFYFGGPGGSDC